MTCLALRRRSQVPGYKATLVEGGLALHPCSHKRRMAFVQCPTWTVVRGSPGHSVPELSWGKPRAEENESPIGWPRGTDRWPFPAPKHHSACFQMPLSATASIPPNNSPTAPPVPGLAQGREVSSSFPKGFRPGPLRVGGHRGEDNPQCRAGSAQAGDENIWAFNSGAEQTEEQGELGTERPSPGFGELCSRRQRVRLGRTPGLAGTCPPHTEAPAGTHDWGWLSAPVPCAVANVPRRIRAWMNCLLFCGSL